MTRHLFHRRGYVTLAALLLALGDVSGQQRGVTVIENEVISVPVTVNDRRGRFITGLKQQGKKDLIPGRDATIQLRADKPGLYRGQCAEFCGYQHGFMAFLVYAEPPSQFEAWAESQRQSAPEPATADPG